MNEKFNICLLIDVSFFRSPSECWVCWFSAVDFWLRVDGEKFAFVHLLKMFTHSVCLWCNASLREREFLYLAGKIINEYFLHIIQRLAFVSPEFLFFLKINGLELLAEADKALVRCIISTEGWRSTDTPSSIWILIPLVSSSYVRWRIVSPENWSNLFIGSFGWSVIW